MAAVIRLYRRFYCINSSGSGDSYTLIDPINLIASSFLKDTSNLIETIPTIQKESVGTYFVDLDPNLYSYDNTYDLKWTVEYTNSSGNKNLLTTFKLKPISISSEMSYGLEDAAEMSYEISEAETIEISLDENNDFNLDETITTDTPEIIEIEILKEN